MSVLIKRLASFSGISWVTCVSPQSVSSSRYPEPGCGLLSSLSIASRRFSSPAYSGMHATPALFGPTQRPLVANRLHQAPVSLDVAIVLLNRVGPTFIDLRRLPPDRFHLADPVASTGHSLAFDSLTPCEVGDILRSGCYPCVVRANTEPPGSLPPSPGSFIHRCSPSLEHLYGRAGWAELSSAVADSRSVVFASRRPFDDEGRTTLLSLAQRRCRPTASSVCTLPLVLRVDKHPLVATPGSHACARGGTSLSPEPCRLSPSAYLGFRRQAFNLTVLRAM